MNELQRALLGRVIELIGATRWPGGRRVTAQERRWLAWFALAYLR